MTAAYGGLQMATNYTWQSAFWASHCVMDIPDVRHQKVSQLYIQFILKAISTHQKQLAVTFFSSLNSETLAWYL